MTSPSRTATDAPTAGDLGQTAATTGTTGSRYTFAGACGYGTDGDAAHMHVGARCCDPQVERFASRDTERGGVRGTRAGERSVLLRLFAAALTRRSGTGPIG